MNTITEHSDAWVCVDCYFAHHYGAHQDDDGLWYAGEDDEPVGGSYLIQQGDRSHNREPLAQLDGYNLSDNTDSETGEGIDDFSWGACPGCGSTLGGARYRLAVWAVAK